MKITLDVDARTIVALRAIALERGIIVKRGIHVGDGNIGKLLDAIARSRRRRFRVK